MNIRLTSLNMLIGKLCLLLLMDVQYLLANRSAFIYPIGVGADLHSGYSCTLLCPNNIETAAKQCHLSTLSPLVSLSFVTFSMPVPEKGLLTRFSGRGWDTIIDLSDTHNGRHIGQSSWSENSSVFVVWEQLCGESCQISFNHAPQKNLHAYNSSSLKVCSLVTSSIYKIV